jgi:hypothetical protein
MKVLAFLGMFGIAALLPAQNTVSVEGVVINAATGAGIGGVTVFAAGHSILTDEAGVFRVAGLKPGDYSGYVAKQRGYLGDFIQFRFHVNADGTPARPRVEMVPPATLRGRVLGIDGMPAQANVYLGPTSRDSVSTNDDGYFTFDQLAPGSYTLLGEPKDAEPVSTPEGLRTGVVSTYYPSALESSQAESISIRAGADLSGYEIRLQSAPVYRVSGMVLDLNGEPAPNAVVQLLDKVADRVTGPSAGQMFRIQRSSVAGAANATQSVSTGEDGTFEFASVRPGDWIIRVESDSVRDEILHRDVVLFCSETISLGGQDLEDLKLRLRMPFDLSGTVDGGSAGVTLTGETGYFGGSVRSDADGRLRFEGVIPGRYLISAVASGNYYASVQLGSSDVTGQTVELTASSPPLRVVLKQGGTVRWTLDPSNSWTVVLFPRTLTGFGYYAPDLMRSSQLTGIPPGEYYAIALDQFNPYTMADAPQLRELVPRATSVRVEEGADAFVELKINHVAD